jgi:2-polyprenyl-6-methoxyphenol hydroxylase-like FAD-dependent oxidoreductase
MKGKAIVIGGSIGGLFAATLLRRQGWQVEIYERVGVELSGRGAGIVTHAPLLAALELAGVSTVDLGVVSENRVAYRPDSSIETQFSFPQLVTSWDRLQSLLRAQTPDAQYHLGHVLQSFETRGSKVHARFANGVTAEADVLIGADGFRSTVRQSLFPEVQPVYAGYVVWRGLADEADLPTSVRENVFENFGFFLPDGDGEVIGYPIAGANNDVRAGHRRYNFVWYRVVSEADLHDMLTDAAGVTHDISIPPPLIRSEVLHALKAEARAKLPKGFVDILDQTNSLFFTPIYDLASPRMQQGPVALLGDAAYLARPHIGAGVTKAAEDAVALAQALAAATEVKAGLVAYSDARAGRNHMAYARAQHMGEYLMPRYTSDVEKQQWQRDHNLATIMRDTAVLNFYEE